MAGLEGDFRNANRELADVTRRYKLWTGVWGGPPSKP